MPEIIIRANLRNADPPYSRPFAAIAERLCLSNSRHRQPAAGAGLGTGAADERQALRPRTGAGTDRRVGGPAGGDAERNWRQAAVASRADDYQRPLPAARPCDRRGPA